MRAKSSQCSRNCVVPVFLRVSQPRKVFGLCASDRSFFRDMSESLRGKALAFLPVVSGQTRLFLSGMNFVSHTQLTKTRLRAELYCILQIGLV